MAAASDVLLAARIQAAAEVIATIVANKTLLTTASPLNTLVTDAITFLDAQFVKGENH